MKKTLNVIPTMTYVKKFFIAAANETKITLSGTEVFGKAKVEVIFTQTGRTYKHVLKVGGKIVGVNELDKNKNRSIEEIYTIYDKLPFVKAAQNDKDQKNQSDSQKLNAVLNTYTEEFSDYIGDSFDDDHTKMSEEELKNFVGRIFAKEEEVQRLRTLNKKVKEYESKIKTYKTLPPKLLELAVTNKGTISKLEKAMILKARRLVV